MEFLAAPYNHWKCIAKPAPCRLPPREACEESNVRSEVIPEQEVMGRKGDSSTFDPTFKEPLHTGAEFKLDEKRRGWLYIEPADGRRCWIPESAAGII
jgi:hypothetical protein